MTDICPLRPYLEAHAVKGGGFYFQLVSQEPNGMRHILSPTLFAANKAELLRQSKAYDAKVVITEPRVYLTEDGYRLTEQPDGTWSDGDLTFASLDELQDAVDGQLTAAKSG